MTTSSLLQLRAEVRAWLDENVPPDLPLPRRGHDISPEVAQWVEEFRPKLGAKGWIAPQWPKYLGGGGYSPTAVKVILEEVQRTRIPPLGINNLWVMAMRVWGTEVQKGKWLPPSLRGDITVFQILSEPTGGSDLAHQDTTAIRNGDRFLVNGSKGYTGAQMMPDYLFTLVTTDPEGVRYENLSMIIVDAKDPGVNFDTRKTFMGGTQRAWALHDVWIPEEYVVGGVGNGWAVANTILDLERGAPGVDKDKQREVEIREREYWQRRDEP